MESKKVVRSTNAQLRHLVDYMSVNTLFANGEFTGPLGARRIMEEWERLRGFLGQYGPDKTVVQWKQTWRDIKRKARRENANANKTGSKTGNRINVPVLSDMTLKILDAIGHNCSTGIGPEESAIGEFYNEFKCRLGRKLKAKKADQQATGGGKAKAQDLTPLQNRLYRILLWDIGEPSPVMQQDLVLPELASDDTTSDSGEQIARESPPIIEEQTYIKKRTTKRVKHEEEEQRNDFFFIEASPELLDKEFEAIGANVAYKLKRMSPSQRCHAELLINKVLIHGLQNNLSNDTDLT